VAGPPWCGAVLSVLDPLIDAPYTAIKDELAVRTTALAVSYQLNPPVGILDALGPRPKNTIDGRRWDKTVIHHAEARMRLGPEIDLTDPAVLEAASWRTAIRTYHPQPGFERGPVLKLVGCSLIHFGNSQTFRREAAATRPSSHQPPSW